MDEPAKMFNRLIEQLMDQMMAQGFPLPEMENERG
jgi:hypothetical protein